MLIGAVLSIGKVSFSVAIEGRETKPARRRGRPPAGHDGHRARSRPAPEDEEQPPAPAGDAPAAPETRTAGGRKR